MPAGRLRQRIEALLASADVTVGGGRPCDIEVHDPRFFERVLAHGSLGLGESYMDGWWDCESLDQFFHNLLINHIDERVVPWREALLALRARLINLQRGKRAYKVGQDHYDIGDDLYERMLDKRMIYSCGYWREAGDLDAAQEAKLDLVCRKLGLEPGMRVLDVGCGWGGMARFAAERYGVEVTGITVSRHQYERAQEICAGLPVDIRLEDYHDTPGTYDRILSIGMFEHVGYKNYRPYMEKMRALLKPDGLFLLHFIGRDVSETRTDPWIERYIFPNSMIPSAAQVTAAMEHLFVIEDWHNFGPDYDRTLMAWRANFDRRWPEIAQRYGERFRRMWHYYLGVSAGAFRSRRDQLWQLVLSPEGVPGGLIVPR